MNKNIFSLHFYNQLRKESDPDPLVRGTDPGILIRIRTKKSRIPNTGQNSIFLVYFYKGKSVQF